MTRNIHSFAAAAAASLLILAGCGQQNEPVVVGGSVDPMERELANAAPVELPPSIRASRTYRCRDNSLAYVEFFSNNTANFRTEPNGTPTRLEAADENSPFTAEGYSVSGSGEEVTIAQPGRASQSCHI